MKKLIEYNINKEYDLVVLEREGFPDAPYLVTLYDIKLKEYSWNMPDKELPVGYACTDLKSAGAVYKKFASIFYQIFPK